MFHVILCGVIWYLPVHHVEADHSIGNRGPSGSHGLLTGVEGGSGAGNRDLSVVKMNAPLEGDFVT